MPNKNDNTENTYKAKSNDQKEQEKQSAEKAGSLAARGALDYATGGQIEKFRNMPVVGNKIKGLEDKAGKKIGKLDKLSGGKIGKISKKLDDAGALDAADKGLSMVGGASPEGAATGGSGAAPSLNNAKKAEDAANNIANSQNNSNNKEKDGSAPSESSTDSSTDSSSSGKSTGNMLSSLGGLNFDKLKRDPRFIAICAGAFLFFIIIGGTVSIFAASNPDGSGDYRADGNYGDTDSSDYSISGGEYASKLVEIAEKEIGNNEANRTHAKYLYFLGSDSSTRWCAAFVSWCANEAGIDTKIIPHTASVSSFLDYFKKQGVFKSLSSNYKPVAGDLMIWKAKGVSHIGIVKEYNSDKNQVITIEGNSSNAVRQNIYKFSTLQSQGVVGFAHPSYPVTNNDTDNSNVTNLSGKTIIVPEGKGLGVYATREGDLATISLVDTPGKIKDLWKKEGSKYDSKGFCKLYGRYMVATTSTFGTDGEKIDFYMSDGTIIHTIKTDTKSQKKTSYDPHPANRWGHGNGANILEFFGKKSIGNSPYTALGLRGTHVVKAVNGGSIFK